MHHISRFVLLFTACTLLAACGNRGPLTLPPRPQAVKNKPAPVPAAEQAPAAEQTAPDNISPAPEPKQ